MQKVHIDHINHSRCKEKLMSDNSTASLEKYYERELLGKSVELTRGILLLQDRIADQSFQIEEINLQMDEDFERVREKYEMYARKLNRTVMNDTNLAVNQTSKYYVKELKALRDDFHIFVSDINLRIHGKEEFFLDRVEYYNEKIKDIIAENQKKFDEIMSFNGEADEIIKQQLNEAHKKRLRNLEIHNRKAKQHYEEFTRESEMKFSDMAQQHEEEMDSIRQIYSQPLRNRKFSKKRVHVLRKQCKVKRKEFKPLRVQTLKILNDEREYNKQVRIKIRAVIKEMSAEYIKNNESMSIEQSILKELDDKLNHEISLIQADADVKYNELKDKFGVEKEISDKEKEKNYNIFLVDKSVIVAKLDAIKQTAEDLKDKLQQVYDQEKNRLDQEKDEKNQEIEDFPNKISRKKDEFQKELHDLKDNLDIQLKFQNEEIELLKKQNQDQYETLTFSQMNTARDIQARIHSVIDDTSISKTRSKLMDLKRIRDEIRIQQDKKKKEEIMKIGDEYKMQEHVCEREKASLVESLDEIYESAEKQCRSRIDELRNQQNKKEEAQMNRYLARLKNAEDRVASGYVSNPDNDPIVIELKETYQNEVDVFEAIPTIDTSDNAFRKLDKQIENKKHVLYNLKSNVKIQKVTLQSDLESEYHRSKREFDELESSWIRDMPKLKNYLDIHKRLNEKKIEKEEIINKYQEELKEVEHPKILDEYEEKKKEAMQDDKINPLKAELDKTTENFNQKVKEAEDLMNNDITNLQKQVENSTKGNEATIQKEKEAYKLLLDSLPTTIDQMQRNSINKLNVIDKKNETIVASTNAMLETRKKQHQQQIIQIHSEIQKLRAALRQSQQNNQKKENQNTEPDIEIDRSDFVELNKKKHDTVLQLDRKISELSVHLANAQIMAEQPREKEKGIIDEMTITVQDLGAELTTLTAQLNEFKHTEAKDIARRFGSKPKVVSPTRHNLRPTLV